jgi:Ca2+-binding EF-hand superfamily protein
MNENIQDNLDFYQIKFNFIDKDKDGILSIQELEYALGVLGTYLKKKEFDELEKESSSYNLEKFLEVCQNKVDYNKIESSMIESFKILESDKEGFISQKDLISILKKYNEKISDKDIKDIIKEAQPDKNGYININDLAKDMIIK